MFGIGMSELFIILVIALILFGAKRLPEIGSGLGKGIKNFKKAFQEHEDEVEVTPKIEKKEDSVGEKGRY